MRRSTRNRTSNAGLKRISSSRNFNNRSKEFDWILERMQDPKAKKAMKAAFDLAPAELGRNAVKAAARSSLILKRRKSRATETT